MDEQRWTPEVGEVVAVVTVNDYGRRRSVEQAAVNRIGKRDIVLDDDRRFRIRDLEAPHNGGSWHGTTTRLVRLTDPVVATIVAEQIHRRRLQDALAACESFRYGRDNVTAADVILALAPLTGAADVIRAALAPTPAAGAERGEGE